MKIIIKIIDFLFLPIVFLSSIIMFVVRRIGFNRLKMCKRVFLAIGVIPIINHYYEPLFDKKNISKDLSVDRNLPGIKWNIEEQLSILESFDYNDELLKIPRSEINKAAFYFNNDSFGAGDAEYWYSIIRLKKPRNIIEIGSGNSTKLARLAIDKNKAEDGNYSCNHICIEPYEAPWLESLGVNVIRKKVELVDKKIFDQLKRGDILFIDSSHIIRPQGDVLFECLELLPTLAPGVIVHFHDIFTPRDYPEEWVFNQIKLWNEQYLLEAFLTSNKEWRIIGALNFIHHNYYDRLKEKALTLTPEREPGSFYIVKNN